MCDTLVALGNATRDGSVIFAKNSDREPNEAHLLEWHPHAQHPAGSTVRCTYIEIPQVEETYEILLCKPFWLWGCEMGANEKGVIIGNEAVFTREPYAPTGLLGMDLMRLALERAATADEALRVITDLIAQYGQGGACGYRNKRLRYHNSFIIADAQSAWVLETAGRYWAAERVRDVRTISNRLTIGHEYDLASPGLVEHALERGWCRSREEFHFARCYSDWFYSTFSHARERQADSTAYLEAYRGRIGVETMMAALRRHARGSSDHPYDPAHGSMADICMHAGDPLTRASQTTGSLVAHLTSEGATYWVTGTSSPCTSIFKPVFLNGQPLPAHGPRASGTFDAEALWWRHERLHRAVLEDYPARLAMFAPERDALEAEFLVQVNALNRGASAEARSALSQRCFDRAREATEGWIQRVSRAPRGKGRPFFYRMYWRAQNREAQFPR